MSPNLVPRFDRFEVMSTSGKFVSFVGNVVWVIITCFNAKLLLEALPESWFRPAIPISMIISSLYGRIAKERKTWWIKLSRAHLWLVGVVTVAVYLKLSVGTDVLHISDIVRHIYVHFAFWVCLSVKATDLSQVVLPMMLLIRPVHCAVLILVLTLLDPGVDAGS